MSSQSFRCPSCNASLTYDDPDAATVTCEYCNNTVIVPKTLRRRSAISITATRKRGGGCLLIGILLAVGLGAGLLFFLNFESVSAPESENIPGFSQVTAAPPSSGYFEQLLIIGGEEGSGAGFFDDTRWLGVDGDGRIYAADYNNKGRVQVFAADGRFLAQWRSQGEGIISHMVVARDGAVYILEPGGGIFAHDGVSGELTGKLPDTGQSFKAMAITLAGDLVAVGRDGMARFNAAGEVELTAPDLFDNIESDAPISVSNIAVDGAGNLYVATTFDSAIYKFNEEGTFVDRIGQEGDETGDFTSPSALAVDGQGRIFVDDFSNILLFDSNGRYLDSINVDGIAFTLLFDTENNLYRMNRNDNRIEKYALLK